MLTLVEQGGDRLCLSSVVVCQSVDAIGQVVAILPNLKSNKNSIPCISGITEQVIILAFVQGVSPEVFF